MTVAPKVAPRRGRKPKAAQSLDEALQLAYSGAPLPKRPRNEFERQAFEKRRGRKPDPISKTRQAAELAAYKVQTEGAAVRQAAREAAEHFGVNADNVRKGASKLIDGPTVVLQYRGKATWFAAAQTPQRRPLMLTDEEAEAAFPQAPTGHP